MGARIWATFGNILKISAVFSFLGGGLLGYRAIQTNQLGGPRDLVLALTAGTILSFVLAVVFWNLKGPLIRGNLIARIPVGLYMLLYVIGSFGFGLLFIGIVYLFTSEPDAVDFYRPDKPAKPRFAPPPNWQQTARVGPSGAMLYGSAARESAVGIFDSWLPVQVVEKRHGVAHVIAATGERGWIDDRTLLEGA
jgi:hypothetical protein